MNYTSDLSNTSVIIRVPEGDIAFNRLAFYAELSRLQRSERKHTATTWNGTERRKSARGSYGKSGFIQLYFRARRWLGSHWSLFANHLDFGVSDK